MSQNVEKFLLEFIFKDKDTLKNVKALATALDQVGESAEKAGNKEQKRAKQAQTETKKQLALAKKRTVLENAIIRAKKLGIKVDSYDNSSKNLTDILALDKEIAAVNREIARSRRKATDETIAQAKVKEAQKIRKAEERAYRESAKRKKDREASLTKKRRSKELKRADFILSDDMRFLSKENPTKAADILKRAEKAFKSYATTGQLSLKSIRAELRETNAAIRAHKRNVSGLQTVQRGLTDSTRNMIRSYVSLYAIFAGTSAIMRTGKDFDQMTGAMTAATGSAELAQQEIQYLEELSLRLGLGISSTAEQYSKFLFAVSGKLPTEQVRELFTNVAEAGTALGVSQERMKLSFIALQQMMNKNQVRSEELKNQLAESFPGAVQIFARALGKTEAEMFAMMDRGELLATEVLPLVGKEMAKVAASGGALQTRLEGAAKASDIFFTRMEKVRKQIFFSGYDEGVGEFFISLTRILENNSKVIEDLGGIFKYVFKGLARGIEILSPIVSSSIIIIKTLVDTLDYMADSSSGKWVLGILALAAGVKVLSLAIGTLLGKFTLLFMIMEEAIAPFVKGYQGFFERLIGEMLGDPDFDIGIDDIFKSVQDIFGDGSLGSLVAALLIASPAMLILASALRIFSGSILPLKGLKSIFSGKKGAKGTAASGVLAGLRSSLTTIAKHVGTLALAITRLHPIIATLTSAIGLLSWLADSEEGRRVGTGGQMNRARRNPKIPQKEFSWADLFGGQRSSTGGQMNRARDRRAKQQSQQYVEKIEFNTKIDATGLTKEQLQDVISREYDRQSRRAAIGGH